MNNNLKLVMADVLINSALVLQFAPAQRQTQSYLHHHGREGGAIETCVNQSLVYERICWLILIK